MIGAILPTISERLNREVKAFQILTPQGRALLVCSQLLGFSAPFVGVFLNLYLWRLTNDLYMVVLFNLFFYLSISFGFVVNGLMLRRIRLNTLFSIGFLFQMIIPVMIILLHQSIFSLIAPLGIISGFGSAFYWANKNYLDFHLNSEANRHYFVGLDSSLGSLSGILAPIAAGFIIDGIGRFFFKNDTAGYYLSFLVAALILALGAFVAKKYIAVHETIPFELRGYSIVLRNVNWSKARTLIFLWGVINGSLLLTSSVLAFDFVSKAFGVGLFNGLGGLAGIIGGYLAARYAIPKRRLQAAIVGTIILVLGAIVFGITPTLIGYLAFIVFIQVGGYLTWTVAYGLIMREIDRGATTPQEKYHYVIDNEIFLNLGRIIGLGGFLLLLSILNLQDSFRSVIIVSAVFNLINLWAIKRANE